MELPSSTTRRLLFFFEGCSLKGISIEFRGFKGYSDRVEVLEVDAQKWSGIVELVFKVSFDYHRELVLYAQFYDSLKLFGSTRNYSGNENGVGTSSLELGFTLAKGRLKQPQNKLDIWELFRINWPEGPNLCSIFWIPKSLSRQSNKNWVHSKPTKPV